MKIHKSVAQGSLEWLDIRLGKVTASECDALVTPLWKVKTGEGPRTLLYRKLAEKATGKPLEDAFESNAMLQGKLLEPEAIAYLELMEGVKVDRVGFVETDDGLAGCSPDGLIGENNGLELKAPRPQKHIQYLLDGVLPPEYAAQVQWSMFVTERPWWLFESYARGFPPLVVKVPRDPVAQAAMAGALATFNAAFDAAWKTVETWPTSRHP